MQPPKAKKISKVLEKHGHERIDDYFWMNKRDATEVISYLKEENEYVDHVLEPISVLKQELFEEMKDRVIPDEMSVPYKLRGYWYWSAYQSGLEYPTYYRATFDDLSDPSVLLNANLLAEGHEYFALGTKQVSPDSKLLAYSTDTVSRRLYDLKIKDIEHDTDLGIKIPNTAGCAWADDNRTLFITLKDTTTLRSNKVVRIDISKALEEGIDASSTNDDGIPLDLNPTTVYREDDDTFVAYCYRSKSGKVIFFGSDSTLTTEYSYIKTDQPKAEPKVIIPRKRGHEYQPDHKDEFFYIRSNQDHKNFSIYRMQMEESSIAGSDPLIKGNDNIFIDDFDLFATRLVVEEREDGLSHLSVYKLNAGEFEYRVKFDDPAYVAYLEVNTDIDSDQMRYGYQSLTTPPSVYQTDLLTQTTETLKEKEIGGVFNKEDYISKRFMAVARDGTKIPISYVVKKEFDNPDLPVLLYAYGSYGYSMSPYFSASRLSLLNRGFGYAIAHIRGGGDMGRQWYEDGKLLKKMNTFTDFIDCGKYLKKTQVAASSELYAMGGSAGGLLMGAVANIAPQDFRGMIAAVPFVDVVTTMLDDSIPLTTGEYDEWGNPNVEEFYRYMLSYSPYDQVSAQEYPNILITTGYHDSQVQYWEPAKWTAKLREHNTGESLILFKTEMEAGHGGQSGRYKQFEDVALNYAFLIGIRKGSIK
jgi:oligopeptidase B